MTAAASVDASAARPDPRFAEAPVLFFGIGAQKTATTWLHSQLRKHPDVWMPDVRKELHYWDSVRPPHVPWGRTEGAKGLRGTVVRTLASLSTDADRRRRAKEWGALERALRTRDDLSHKDYADTLFAGAAGRHAVGEITPCYAVCPEEVLAEMAGLAPDVRFIFMMRDPVERMVSGLRMNERHTLGDAEDPSAQVSAALRAALDEDPSSDRALQRSRYEVTIGALDRVAKPANVIFFFYETLFRQSEVDRLTDFLGVSRMTMDFEERVWVGSNKTARPAPGLLAEARAALADTYDFVRARFGARVPDAWAA